VKQLAASHVRRSALAVTVTVLLPALLSPDYAGAQAFPVKPVRIILGLAPASTADVVTRIIATKMGEELGQVAIVENRAGAGGTIATEAVARAPADGYTLNVSGCSGDAIIYSFVMTGRRPLDPFTDFTPVGQLMRDHWLVVASPALGVASVAELVALGKAKPGALSFPSGGVGSSQHLQAERFRMRVGIDALHVPYPKGGSVTDLMAGRLSYAVQSSAALVPLIKTGKLKGLVVLSTQRLASLPDTPTTVEAGLADLVYNAGICAYAPGATPRPTVARLNAAMNSAAQSADVRQRFAELGVETVQSTPEDVARFVAELIGVVDRLRIAVFGKAR
jgi:tripartite-type tricarboxylate transporter receptor subunit TctC